MLQRKRILHITPLIGRASFGIGPIVLNLAAAQQNLGNEVNIWCYDTPTEIRCLEETYDLHKNTIRSFYFVGPSRLGYSPSMEKSIVERGISFDIVHQHSLWTGISRTLSRWRTKTDRPTVITPQGSLDPWALRQSYWKKRLALMLYERKNLHNVSNIQALSKKEANDFRSFGLKCPISIIPNGISKAWIMQNNFPGCFRKRYGLTDDVRIILFLGRITPKKGLIMLLNAMNIHRDQLRDWKLIVAGVDEFKHQQEVETWVQKLDLQSYVQFVGPQFDQDKRDAFAAADVFVLPSFSEGAPVSILEALGAGVPVLTTKSSPWEELVAYDCGWWTDISVEAVADALQDVLNQSRVILSEKGQRGKQLVNENFTWFQIAEQTLTLYSWLLNEGEQPTFTLTE